MNSIERIFSCQLNHFIHLRVRPLKVSGFEYISWDQNCLCLATRTCKGKPILLTRWQDLLHPQGVCHALWQAMQKAGYSEHDVWAISIVLSRFGFFFEIDQRDIARNMRFFWFYYALQLNTIKHTDLVNKDMTMTSFLQKMMFVLCTDSDFCKKMKIHNNQWLFCSDNLGEIPFTKVIQTVHKLAREKYSKTYEREEQTFTVIETFQQDVVRFLTDDLQRISLASLNWDDPYIDLINPVLFCQHYDNHRFDVLNALAQTANPLQSSRDIFVSNCILMNYSYHVLQKKPTEIFKLKRHLKDQDLFKTLFKAILIRKAGVNKETYMKTAKTYGALQSLLNQISSDDYFVYNSMVYDISQGILDEKI